MVTAYNREVQDKVTQINSVPSSLPSDVEADVCNSWATYSENQKHLRSVLIYKHALLGVAGLSDPVLQLVRADQSANDTFDLFKLASSCSDSLEVKRNELSDSYSEAIYVYGS